MSTVVLAQQSVHGDAVLYDEGRDGYEGQDQHVEDEELLTVGSGGVDVVTTHPPVHALHQSHLHLML